MTKVTKEELQSRYETAMIAAGSQKHTHLCGLGILKKERCVCGVQDGMDAVTWIADAAAQVPSLQSQVAELGRTNAAAVLESSEQRARADRAEAELRQERATATSLRGHIVELRSERDALRARVVALDAALDEAIQEVEGYDGEAAVALRRAQEAALSAPTAETTPSPERAEAKRSCFIHADCDAAERDGATIHRGASRK